ncbi:MAG: tetratricopeptide repeat protein [candidate division Zixibacteria bacterium]|nr:tetratricopeptide repeat protein [candidate division Zixibacteria bacterium]NIR63313.1 tetratricopeptide repeat protein [candidate division Zixibacteria bacterium]NIS17308.1 tetratricopeptide repeat protein [candidate division Zixibacteria bacterium]NIS45298.1 tetratricopeptide repeat protein [candidate division Zixibacteria bacterium]NIT53668.1 tetratricopeptide repeat protein [candidate division Zixibacteria bacterium]
MNPHLSNRKRVVLDELNQIELLVIQGKLSQARTVLAAQMDNYTHAPASAKAELDYYQAIIQHAELEYEKALKKALSSFEYYRSTSDNKKIGRLQKLIARIQMDMGNLSEAEQTYHDCLATWRRIDDRTGIFECQNRLAQIKFILGDYDASADYLLKAIESFKSSARDDLNADITLKRYYGNLARIYILTGNWGEAEKLLRECVEHNRQNRVTDSLIRNLLSLGYLGIRLRDQRLCEDCFAEVKSLLDSTQLPREEGILYEYLGEYYTEFNKFDLALQAFQRALMISRKMPSNNTLLSQTLRRRAELYLATARYDLAYKDALEAHKAAQKVGESVEVAASLKVLALASLAYSPANDNTDYFSEAERAFSLLGEKYEVARMHLAFSSIEIEEDDLAKLEWCRNHLRDARKLFNELEAGYYIAVSDLIEAELDYRNSEFDRAFNAIAAAEKYFEESGNEDDINAVHGLRRKIESAMLEIATSDANEYNLVRSIIEPGEYTKLRQADLNYTLQFLAERIFADTAFIGLLDFAQKDFTPLAHYEFSLEKLEDLKGVISYTGIKPGNLKPYYITSPYQSSNGSAEIFDAFGDAGSIILIPMDLGSQKSAIVFLQRNRNSARSGFFSNTDLNLSIAFADILAFRAIEEEKLNLEKDNFRLRTQLEDRCAFPNIVTGNKSMLKMLEKVIQVKDSPISILIQGETGSGKDLLAKTIHYNSVRKDKRFISVNCAALPETLLESELFGYKKGAFTGADRDRAGLFEEADGGTFFLDEIGEMPLSIQAKLLRVLEDQEVVRLGDTRGRKVDVRLLSATNSDLKEMMDGGRFRQDLYYRLSAMQLRIPPLRERKDDIPLLINHFLEKYDSSVSIDPEVQQIFMNFSWPGNVRELDNEIKKMILLSGDRRKITRELLSRKFFKDSENRREIDLPEIENFGREFTLYDYISMFEKKYIKEALSKNRWVKKHAANALGIPESTLRLKIKEYDISKE